ncbi:MAG TPA: LptF/LptG family permease [Gemmatimonadaceae bacterium]|nr:LptF/LptG family permease [Gemmatimonadaceae bacterium]
MSWIRTYRLALQLLPAGLRRKHGPAMVALFARELGRARARGRLHGALAGAAGIWDVIRRGAYEHVCAARDTAAERRDHGSPEAWSMDAHGPHAAGANLGGPPMPQPTTRQLLRRHAAAFVIAFVAFTAVLLALFATKQVPALSARGASAGTVAQTLLLAVPFIAAMTIPMAVLVAVLIEFTRLGADGTLAAARREHDGVRRLMVPVLAAAAGVAALAFVVTAEIVPRTNERLAAVLVGATAAPSDRTMTIGELREAARRVRPGEENVARAAAYEVEVQKKLALPAACVVLALAGMAIALRVPRGGVWLVIGASGAVLGAYYVVMMAGEDLADRLVVSPVVGMWGANALLLLVALLAAWRPRSPLTSGGGEAAVIRG